jgi:hypothetical protein
VKIPGAAAALVLLTVSSSASAQQLLPPPPDAETGVTRVRLGPFWLNPSVALRDAGVDTNVFNDPEDQNPKSDFTFTLTPQTDVWLRMGRTWLGGLVKEDIVYYREFASERATNESYAVGWVAPLSRVHFDAQANWADRRDRVGYEIDARLQHTDFAYNGSAEVRALGKTFVGVKGAKGEIDYSEDSYYRGESVRAQLNRHETEVDVTVRYQLTPLTNLLVEAGRQEDRFDYEPLRDSDSLRYSVGVNFDPYALVKGAARFGYRRFDPLSGIVPGYEGMTAAIDLSYVALESTKFGVQFSRDIEYSYQIDQPYYLQTGGSASITQRIAGPIDAGARVVLQQLAYRTREDVVALVPDRVDHARMFGASIGYHAGPDLRIAFNVDKQTRQSDISAQRYDGLRVGMSVTYGF